MSTIGTVWDRINALVQAQGYALSSTAFDFDYQPDSKLDHVYHLRSARVATAGYLGGDQAEQHQFTIYLAARTRRQAQGAVRQLKVDLDLIEAAMLLDETNESYGYFVVDDGVQSECQEPPDEGDFVIGRLVALVECDRVL